MWLSGTAGRVLPQSTSAVISGEEFIQAGSCAPTLALRSGEQSSHSAQMAGQLSGPLSTCVTESICIRIASVGEQSIGAGSCRQTLAFRSVVPYIHAYRAQMEHNWAVADSGLHFAAAHWNLHVHLSRQGPVGSNLNSYRHMWE